LEVELDSRSGVKFKDKLTQFFNQRRVSKVLYLGAQELEKGELLVREEGKGERRVRVESLMEELGR